MERNELEYSVKELITEYISLKKVSQNKMAELLNINNGTLSKIMNGKFDSISNEMFLKIKSFFKQKSWILINTRNFVAIQEQCKKAREQRQMIGIIGYTGAGKTTALYNYYTQHPETYFVTCRRSMRTKQLLVEILKALGINYIASDYEMCCLIIDTLNKKNNALLILDEASKLNPTALMYLQDIWDGIESNSGIIIAGVEYLYTHLKRDAEKGKIGVPEFFGRVCSWVNLEEPTKSEINAIVENNSFNPQEILKIRGFKNFRQLKNVIQQQEK